MPVCLPGNMVACYRIANLTQSGILPSRPMRLTPHLKQPIVRLIAAMTVIFLFVQGMTGALQLCAGSLPTSDVAKHEGSSTTSGDAVTPAPHCPHHGVHADSPAAFLDRQAIPSVRYAHDLPDFYAVAAGQPEQWTAFQSGLSSSRPTPRIPFSVASRGTVLLI